ncbi:HypC/HybG/HupF family hydrogenase formation chaperone [Nostocoides sp. F2B08]|uniref:HypC/HybG/HupF family hydrogenase formation chaperone n=1 Tax=Nostocoides sp. F2B08 TaxID=2653936 RepID=UPI00186B222B|nr:HypC/HybG/HupF family hydrogenase formation chaperone [Tetrasphaera sp. F2B08]
MCLGEVVRLDAVSGASARARLGDQVVAVSLVTLDEHVAPGDWILVHSGFALHRLEPDEAVEALALRSWRHGPSVQGSISDASSPSSHPQEES